MFGQLIEKKKIWTFQEEKDKTLIQFVEEREKLKRKRKRKRKRKKEKRVLNYSLTMTNNKTCVFH